MIYAGEIGKQIEAPTGQPTGYLIGKTANLFIWPMNGSIPNTPTLAASGADADNTIAYFILQGSEYTNGPGQYYHELQISVGNTLLLKSRVLEQIH